MPYSNITELPDQVKALPAAAQKVWMNVVNGLLKKGTDETSAFKQAWAAVKNGWEKKGDTWEAKASENFKFYDIAEIFQLDDKGNSEIQIMKTGEFIHPKYGKFKISEEDLSLFIKNFTEKVRGVDIAVDVEHEPELGAVGWIKKVYKKGKDALYALVEWTKEGLDLVQNGKFRYISPDFNFVWMDEFGKKIKNVLNGVALTNRPFFKNMEPVILSERFKDEVFKNITTEVQDIKITVEGGEKKMGELAEKIKNIIETENISDEDIIAKVSELVGKKEEAEGVTASEFSALKATVESQKAIIETMKSSNAGLELKLKETEAEKKVNDAISARKLMPKQTEWAKAYALKDPEGFAKFIEGSTPLDANLFKEVGASAGGEVPVVLSESEKEVARQLNLKEEDVLKTKKEMIEKGELKA